MQNLKIIGLLIVSSLFVGTAIADDHAEAGPFYAFYHLQTANPAAVVAAMDKFWASDCGKKYPADVALSEEVFNGGNASTCLLYTSPSPRDRQKSRMPSSA